MDPLRERIIDAVIALVAADGYDATGVEAIVAEAGTTVADFHQRFSGKEDLCRQAFEVVSDRFDRHLLPLYLSPQPWRPRMRAAAYAAARYCREHSDEIEFGIAAVCRDPHYLLGERTLRLHLEEIDSVRREMAVSDRVPKAAAEFVVGVFLRLVMRSHAAGSYEQMEAAVPELIYRANELYLGTEAAEEELLIARQRLRGGSPDRTRSSRL